MDSFIKAVDFIIEPEQQKNLRFLNKLAYADLSRKQQADILAIFKDPNNDTDDLLNDVMNPHPIAAKLWGDRMQLLSQDRIEYTKTFQEGAESLYKDADEKVIEKYKNRRGLLSPTPNHLPWNCAIEEISHMKLERLAREFFKLDIDTDRGIAYFDQLVQKYDISPGELTLERTHGYPPEWHTYEELPIIKFDGYDPVLPEPVRPAKPAAHDTTSKKEHTPHSSSGHH